MAIPKLFTLPSALRSGLAGAVSTVGKTLGLPEFGVSEAIQDPNRSIFTASPSNLSTGPAPAVKAQSVGTGGGGTDAGGSTLGAGTSSGVPAFDPTALRNAAQGTIQQAMNLYQQLFGQVDANVADKRGQLDQQYNTQQGQLNTDYQNTSQGLPAAYAGRGLGSSSYLENAQQTAADTYKNSLDTLNQGRNQNYAQLGQFAANEKAQLGAGQSQLGKIDLSQYTDQSSLMSLRDQIDAQLASLQQTSAGLETNPQYIAGLNAITASQQTGSAALQQQLQTLSQSNAPSFAKAQIAQGLLKSAGQDPNDPFWQNFWSSLSQQPVATAQPTPTGA